MTFWGLFDGIHGIGLALQRVGMECTLQCEIEQSCVDVLNRHFPDVDKIDDVNRLRACLEPRNAGRHSREFVRPDGITGGFPCQDLSVAGRRAGLAGERSGQWFVFRRIVALVRPDWVLIENVPGLLSSNGGRDMGTVLRQLGDMGYGWAYRVFDAQWFGVAQRRRRVFVVGCLGDWTRAAEILFERDSVPWDSPTREEAGQRVAGGVAACLNSGGNDGGFRTEPGEHVVATLDANYGKLQGCSGQDMNHGHSHLIHCNDSSRALTACKTSTGRLDPNEMEFIALKAEGADASEDGTGRRTPIVPVSFSQNQEGAIRTEHIASTLNQNSNASGRNTPMVAYQCHGSNVGPMGHLRSGNGNETGGVPFISHSSYSHQYRQDSINSIDGPADAVCPSRTRVQQGYHVGPMAVRRLTPTECERLQGLPDGWTQYRADGTEISDSARYRMIGNGVAVPCLEWIGRRIMEHAK